MKRDPLALLQARAANLSKEETARAAAPPVAVFLRAGQLYGIDLAELVGGGRLRDFTPVPGAPAWVLGATLNRGVVLSLVDLPALWEQAEQGVTDLVTFVVAGHGGGRVGLVTEELLGVVEPDALPLAYQGRPLAGVTAVTSVGGKSVLLLSMEALLADGRLSGGGS